MSNEENTKNQTYLAEEGLGDAIENLYNNARAEESDKKGFVNLQNVVINSKSGPFSDDEGVLRQSDGGLASGTHPVAEKTGAKWVHLGGDGDENHLNENGEMEIPASYTTIPKFFNEEVEDEFYYDVANQELWPIMHDMPQNFHEADEEAWNSYRRVNWEFAQEINEQAENGDPIWIHDYQNMLVPEMVRAKNEESPILYTHHIPIPEPDGDNNFTRITKDREVLEGLAATDIIGVHTDKDRQNLLEIAEKSFDADVDYDESSFELGDSGKTVVTNVPLGIDNEKYSGVETDEIQRRIDICDEDGLDYFSQIHLNGEGEIERRNYEDDLNIIFAPARADYSKGLDRLIDAYEEFQERNPEEAEKTRFVLKPQPTRGDIKEYSDLWDYLTTRGEQNEGIDLRTDWIENDELVEIYRASDVIAAPSYKDGLNLVAKEGVAANATGDHTGTLMLGEGVGAAEQLGDDAVLVDPNDPEEMSYLLEEAFEMGYDERAERMSSMHENVEEYDVEWWTQQYDGLAGRARQLRSEKA